MNLLVKYSFLTYVAFYRQCLFTATEQTRIEIGSTMECCYDDVFKFSEFCHRNLFMLTSVSSNMPAGLEHLLFGAQLGVLDLLCL